ncbi:MAG: CDP-glycerol glycerophosphotransferase family protein [Motiliproteus sp.]
MKNIKKLISLTINYLIYLISNLIPKSKNIWVFGAWYGEKYSDNSKAFFEYVNNSNKDEKAIWISKNIEIVKNIRNQGYRAYHYKTLPGIWYQLISSTAFVCQAIQDDLYAPSIGKKTIVINLWHGIPLKKIMYDAFKERKTKKNMNGIIVDHITPYEKRRNDYIISTNEETKKILTKAFRVNPEQTLITGLPRNDVFFKKKTEPSKKYSCIYMPTLRGGVGTECDLFEMYGFDVNSIEAKLKEENIFLVLRMHPVNTPPERIKNLIENSTHIKIDSSEDIYTTIINHDCLITDYSSIYFDFILSNKPIIFSPFDLTDYKKNERSLYYNYKDVTLTPYCMNWDETIDRIIDIKKNGISKEYDSCYKELKLKFHEEQYIKEFPFSNQLYRAVRKINNMSKEA